MSFLSFLNKVPLLGDALQLTGLDEALGGGEGEKARNLRDEALRHISGVSTPALEQARGFQYDTKRESQIEAEIAALDEKLAKGADWHPAQKRRYLSAPALQKKILEKELADLQHDRKSIEFNPTQERSMLQQATAMRDISTDPGFKQRSNEALARLGSLSQEGLTQADQAGLQLARQQIDQQQGAQRQAALQNLAARGLGGSGAELMALVGGSQAGANAMANAGLGMAQGADQRAMNAASQLGNLAGSLQGQDFSQQAQTATAVDAINAFNALNQINQQERNVSRGNDAKMFNILTPIAMQQELLGSRNTIAQRDYDNRLDLAKAKADASLGSAQGYAQDSQRGLDRFNKLVDAGVKKFSGGAGA